MNISRPPLVFSMKFPRRWRLEHLKITQVEIAKMVGWHPERIGDLEQHRPRYRNPTVKTLAKLCEAYELEPQDFFEEVCEDGSR